MTSGGGVGGVTLTSFFGKVSALRRRFESDGRFLALNAFGNARFRRRTVMTSVIVPLSQRSPAGSFDYGEARTSKACRVAPCRRDFYRHCTGNTVTIKKKPSALR